MKGALAPLACVVMACGGASQGSLEGPAPPTDNAVETVVLDPTDEEREKGGAETVTITSPEGVTAWIQSPAFFETGWTEGPEGAKPRYRVSFQGASGEVAVYWIGTTKTSPITYLCFGFCSSWWVAPARADGAFDSSRHRIIPDDEWQPLTREWYLAEQPE